MAQMPTAVLTEYLGTNHAVAGVPLFVNDTRCSRLVKARPTTTGIEFTIRLKQRFTTTPTGISPCLGRGPILTRERALSTFLTENMLLLGCELLAPVRVIFVSHAALPVRCLCCSMLEVTMGVFSLISTSELEACSTH